MTTMATKSSKSFIGLTDEIQKAVDKFTASGKTNTILCIMCNRSEYRAFVSMRKELPEKLEYQHRCRLLNTLLSNKELFDQVFSVVEPAIRYYKRDEKKQAKKRRQAKQSNNH